MKKTWKLMMVAICATLLIALVAVVAYANSTIETDVTLANVQVAAGGSVSLRFNFSDLGTATKIVAEVGGDKYEYPAENTVIVPLRLDQLSDTVQVYAMDGEDRKGETIEYSVREYAMEILNSNDEKYVPYHTSMRTLLNWGAAADVFFNESASSEINEGIFSRGTNPVDDVTAIYTDASSVVKTETDNIKVEGTQVFLDAGNTTMTFYFAYEGSNKLTATVQKADGTPVEAPVLYNAEENLYLVNIHNVGVAVFDRLYTVSVSEENVEGTATAGIKMIEYLNRIAFNAELTAENRNLAKAMFQFYTQTMNTVTECDHLGGLHNSYDMDGANEHVSCSKCFADLMTYPKTLAYIEDYDVNMYYDSATGQQVFGSYTIENGELFVRSEASAAQTIQVTPSCNVDKGYTQEVTTGDYFFIKYRHTPKEGHDTSLQLRVKYNDYGAYVAKSGTATGEWVVAVIEVPEEYRNMELTARVDFYAQGILDVAYWGFANNVAEVQAMLAETETYKYLGDSFANAGAVVDKNGTCTAHDFNVVSEAVEGGTRYSYLCTLCGEIAPSRTIPNTVTKLVDVSTAGTGVVFTSLGGATATKTVENNEVFIRVTGASTACNAIGWEAQDTGVKYLVFKYRTSGTGDTYLQLGYGGSMGNSFSNIMFPDTADWATVVVDLTEYPHQDKIFCARLFTSAAETLDIAYMALTTADSVTALVETDTYMLFKAKAMSQPKYGTFNADGSCAVHVPVISGENWICSNCQEIIMSVRTYPNTVKYYADATNLGQASTNGVWGAKDYADLAITTDGNEVFVRATAQANPVNTPTFDPFNAMPKGGAEMPKYAIVKYRANGSALSLLIRTYPGGSGTVDQNTISVPTAGDEWVTVVIDLSQTTQYKSGNVGRLLVRPTMTGCTQVDIAYVASTTSDNIAALIETETYYSYVAKAGTAGSNTLAIGDAALLYADGSCSVHNNVTSNGTEWICPECGKTVAPVRTYNAGTTTVADATTAGTNGLFTNIGGTTIQKVVEDNEAFVRVINAGANTACDAFNWLTNVSTDMKYLVLKYRTSGAGSVYLQLANAAGTSNSFCNVMFPDTEEWTTVVVDITNYDKSEFLGRFYVANKTIDVSYAVLTSSLEGLIDTDTYLFGTAAYKSEITQAKFEVRTTTEAESSK